VRVDHRRKKSTAITTTTSNYSMQIFMKKVIVVPYSFDFDGVFAPL